MASGAARSESKQKRWLRACSEVIRRELEGDLLYFRSRLRKSPGFFVFVAPSRCRHCTLIAWVPACGMRSVRGVDGQDSSGCRRDDDSRSLVVAKEEANAKALPGEGTLPISY